MKKRTKLIFLSFLIIIILLGTYVTYRVPSDTIYRFEGKWCKMQGKYWYEDIYQTGCLSGRYNNCYDTPKQEHPLESLFNNLYK